MPQSLLAPTDLVKCGRKLLAKLRRLNRSQLETKLVKVRSQLITEGELEELMARRDRIVEISPP